MPAGRLAELATVVVFAAVVTTVLAAPVLRAPSERVFGRELVGRHHDPFSVMAAFEQPVRLSFHTQPLTDLAGTFVAQRVGAVAAYNWLVLVSFPLSALGAYLLARHVGLSRVAATIAALAYAFSPFHLAHAAYHPHIAQTQWVPFYLLALWRCLDRPSLPAIGLLGAASSAVVLSNFYGGFIMAVLTPLAGLAYWIATRRDHPGAARRLWLTVACLGVMAAAGWAYAALVGGVGVGDREVFAVPRDAVVTHSARWWSYLLPPAAHPLFGSSVRPIWDAAGVREGLVEQQVSLGWGILALGLIAVWRWRTGDRQPASLVRLPVLVLVAAVALLCSLAPEATFAGVTIMMPSAVLYDALPMFRAYARFGVVVQLMAVLLAGIGIDCLRRGRRGHAPVAGAMLVALSAGEYVVAPSALWRDALPTAAHRWIARHPAAPRAFDCAPLTAESASVEWLTAGRVRMGSATSDCTEPNLGTTLAGGGYTHLVVRRSTADGAWFATRAVPPELGLAAEFDDGQVFAVTAGPPSVFTAAMTGFAGREHGDGRSWRWMASDGAWTIVNTTTQPVVTTLVLELWAFHQMRSLEVRLDQHRVQTLSVGLAPQRHAIGPLTVPPGGHGLVFHAVETPTVADDVLGNGDPRAVSLAFGSWAWGTQVVSQ